MRVFQLKICRAIQWWYPGHSGVVYVPHDGKIDPKFENTETESTAAANQKK